MTTFAIATLGCKVNQFESEALTFSLEQHGYRFIPFGQPADITIINTCTVTHRADFQSRQTIRRALRSSPGSLVIVTGCYAQVEPDALAEIREVTYLIGNREKGRILDLLPRMERGELPRIQIADIQEETFFTETPLHTFHHHTRAFLKIQDGCNGACSYCIVPRARGRSRSLSAGRILEELRTLKERGFKEVVLTGIHVGAYGLDLTPSSSLETLLERLEYSETPDRIRLSSIEPGDFSPGLVSFLSQSTRVCPHFHIPIQSGNDEVLRGMDRDYDSSFVRDLIQELHERIPDVCIGADMIVGFPGETEEQFKQTQELFEQLPLSYLHVFPFSRRKGTPASQFPRQVDSATIKTRAELLRALGKEKRQAFYRQFLKRELPVLVEDRRDKRTGAWRGLSRNYIPVLAMSQGHSEKRRDWINQEFKMMMTEVTPGGLVGRVLEKDHG